MKFKLVKSFLVEGCSRSGRPSCIEPWLAPLFRDGATCRRFQSSQQSSQKRSEPLRVLFCGSDEFSSANLRALHEEQLRNPGLIESIDVVIRPGKRVGRGNKKIQHPPIRDVATELGLTIHERDTFTGWSMPASINLIIAVSFGLFVPARLLRAARYGGLNVHPSLLPEFRGAAPLHHALLAGRAATGVTLQTLDDRAFDAGVVLAQTPLEDAYAIGESCTTVAELQAGLTPLATEMLVSSLREGRHVPPHRAVDWQTQQQQQQRVGSSADSNSGAPSRLPLPDATAMAPKITSQMRQLVPPPPAEGEASSTPRVWTARQTVLRQRIIGPLWFRAQERQGKVKRVIVDDAMEDVVATPGSDIFNLEKGVYKKLDTHRSEKDDSDSTVPVIFWVPHADESIYLVESQTTALKISRLKIEGDKTKPATVALAHFESEVVERSVIDAEYALR
ncbi:Methionyl-tRNA formyltransferase [Neopestalotiopsis sp. 37M]|nr:Methionyl-tRNA formyltransferase [Neopestalotiopsis sp. 37M]